MSAAPPNLLKGTHCLDPDDIIKLPNDAPGSPAAVQNGCTCPQAENNFGRGRSKNGVFEIDFAADPLCPTHGLQALFGIQVED
jgi:hypothetical protein